MELIFRIQALHISRGPGSVVMGVELHTVFRLQVQVAWIGCSSDAVIKAMTKAAYRRKRLLGPTVPVRAHHGEGGTAAKTGSWEISSPNYLQEVERTGSRMRI